MICIKNLKKVCQQTFSRNTAAYNMAIHAGAYLMLTHMFSLLVCLFV